MQKALKLVYRTITKSVASFRCISFDMKNVQQINRTWVQSFKYTLG